jgi:hypothetical protein
MTNRDWRVLLHEFWESNKKYEIANDEPATHKMIEAAKERFTKRGLILPDAYYTFLEITNGINDGGFIIFGINDDDTNIGLANTNKSEYFYGTQEGANITFGFSSADVFIYNNSASCFQVIDINDPDYPLEQFDDFEALLNYCFNEYY